MNGYVYDFSVDYVAVAVDDILDIRKYLMKNNNMIQKMFGFIKKVFFTGLTILSSVNPLNAAPLNATPLNATPCFND